MITARDMAPGMAIAAVPIIAPLPTQALRMPAAAASLKERVLLMVLYVTVLASSVAFIEPSPHDGLMIVLLFFAVVAGVRFDRFLALPLLLLLVWNVGGLLSALNVAGQDKVEQYVATSFYMAVGALLFACLFAQNTMPRLAAMRSAYVLTATVVALAGIAGYFSLFPGAHALFATYDRALGGFKDPNVFGPFLIWPALIVIERMLVRQIRPLDFAIVVILQLGILLSFSRGAWFHYAVSASVAVALTFIAAPTQRTRVRIFTLSAISVATLAVLFVVLLSFNVIGEMFAQRAQIIQYYDVGEGGRFKLQELALAALLQHPNGMGPFAFAIEYGLQQHNVYLQAFLVYGWLGGMAYLLLLVTTVWVALGTVFVRTPWQPYLITALAAFIGEILEGFVIDTDHWRHFFLLLGMIWGLAAATRNHVRLNSVPQGQVLYAGAR